MKNTVKTVSSLALLTMLSALAVPALAIEPPSSEQGQEPKTMQEKLHNKDAKGKTTDLKKVKHQRGEHRKKKHEAGGEQQPAENQQEEGGASEAPATPQE